MEYDKESLQYINKHYFHAKSEEDINYNTIVGIFTYLLVIEPSLLNAMICFSIIFIVPKCTTMLEMLSKVKVLETENYIIDYHPGGATNTHSVQNTQEYGTDGETLQLLSDIDNTSHNVVVTTLSTKENLKYG